MKGLRFFIGIFGIEREVFCCKEASILNDGVVDNYYKFN